MSDLGALRRLPRALIRAGYVDAIALHGPLRMPRLETDHEAWSPQLAALLGVFFLHGEAPAAALGLPADDVAALVRLGVLVDRGGQISSGELVLLPVLGRLAFVPAPRGARNAYFGDDLGVLLARIPPVGGRVLTIGGGPGLLALVAQASASKVVVVDHDPVAIGCAELNYAMNQVEDKIDARTGAFYEPVRGERFQLVLASVPASPIPVRGAGAYGGADGPELARRVLEGLPAVLDDDGCALIVCLLHGDEQGPNLGFDVARWAESQRLGIALTLSARQPLGAGSPLFETLVARSAKLGGGDERVVRRTLAEHLAQRDASYAYFAFVTASRGGTPGCLTTKHYLRPGGSWLR